MPDFNPANPGDLVYPKYAVVTTEPIDVGLQIIKGQLYMTDALANLIDLVGDLTNGFFQAMVTPDTVPVVAGEDSVQVCGPRTRMMFTTQIAGIKVGEDLYYLPGTTDVTNIVTAGLRIGRLFQIYNLDADNITPKYLTSIGDKVIVETVGPQ